MYACVIIMDDKGTTIIQQHKLVYIILKYVSVADSKALQIQSEGFHTVIMGQCFVIAEEEQV